MTAEELYNSLGEELKKDISFVALVGSHNYCLSDSNSDYDFKIFVYPTFDDMYYTTRKTGIDTKVKGNDLKTTDIRQLKSVLSKSNINFIEVLFSDDIYIPEYNNANLDKYNDELLKFLFHNREKIATMNIPHLIKAVTSSSFHRMNSFVHGGDYKSASQAYKEMWMLVRYLQFKNKKDDNAFLKAIKFDDFETVRQIYFNIRDKKISKEEITNVLFSLQGDMDEIIDKGLWKETPKDLIITSALDIAIKKAVKNRIYDQLYADHQKDLKK